MIGVNRRNFIKKLSLLPIVGKKISEPEGRSQLDELREILFNRPDLFHFRAIDGHFAYVWFEGRECGKEATECVGHPMPGKEVKGAVRIIAKNTNGEPVTKTGKLVTKWMVGSVRWQPIVEVTK